MIAGLGLAFRRDRWQRATLLDHASRGASTEHDHSTVCWILEGDPDAPATVELTHPRD
jgi:hypothetical protein